MIDWFAVHPSRYWTLAWSCFTVLTLAGIGPVLASLLTPALEKSFSRFSPRWLFVALIFAVFLAFRWPLFFVGEELNPDESQLIAGGITLQSDPIYWRSVDGTTHGPLDAYPLLAARLFGLPVGFGSARLIGSLMLIAAILSIYLTLSGYYGEAMGRLGCLPAFCFFAFNTFWDFVHYSSEHAPVLLLGIGAMLLALDLAKPTERISFSWQWFGGGIILGAVPLAKLQGAPIAAALLATGAIIDLCSGGVGLVCRFRRLGFLFLGTAAVPIILVLVTVGAGQAEYAWKTYVVQNLYYTGDRHYSPAEMLRRFWDYADIGTGFYAFAAGMAAFAAITLLRAVTFPLSSLRLLTLSGVFLFVSLAAILAPGRQYTHYLILLIIPATLFAGCLMGSWWQQTKDQPGTTVMRWFLLAAFIGILLWPQINSRTSQPHPYLSKLSAYAKTPVPPVVQQILRYARPGETLGQWGWMCRYYVLTGLRQATRIAHTNQEIQYSPQIEFYRAHYLSDLKRNRPPVFIDTVGPGNFVFQDRASGHESFPALRDYIAQNYNLVADTDGTRVYARKDRLTSP